MTSYEPIPSAPPTLGEALAFPGIYLEPPAGLPMAAPEPRIRRPGRLRRKMATLAAVVATAAVSLAGCTAGGPVAHATVRPFWDGRHPAVWTSPVDPMCEAQIAGRHSVARSGGGGPVFGVVCQRDGSEFVWGIVSGGAR